MAVTKTEANGASTTAKARAVGANPYELLDREAALRRLMGDGGNGKDKRSVSERLEEMKHHLLDLAELHQIERMSRALARAPKGADDDLDDEDEARPPRKSVRDDTAILKLALDHAREAEDRAYEARKDALQAQEKAVMAKVEAASDQTNAALQMVKLFVDVMKDAEKKETGKQTIDWAKVLAEVTANPNHPLMALVGPVVQSISRGIQMAMTPPDIRSQLLGAKDTLELVRELATVVHRDTSADKRWEIERERLGIEREKARWEREDRLHELEERRRRDELRLQIWQQIANQLSQAIAMIPQAIQALATVRSSAPAPSPVPSFEAASPAPPPSPPAPSGYVSRWHEEA